MNLLLYAIFGIVIISTSFTTSYAQEIPEWVKNNVSWWAEGIIGDQEFVHSMQFLIDNGILVVLPPTISDEKTEKIPDWIKNNGKWWAESIITDKEFLNNIEFLIGNGILTVKSNVQSESKEESISYTSSGKFHDGDFFHRTSGTAIIEFSEAGGTLYFDKRFSTVNGPDLFVYLATDKSANDFVNVGRLQSSSGEQTYTIPEDIDLEKYSNVLVWCRAFGVLFGNAELSS